MYNLNGKKKTTYVTNIPILYVQYANISFIENKVINWKQIKIKSKLLKHILYVKQFVCIFEIYRYILFLLN